jgi:hypothetical protein
MKTAVVTNWKSVRPWLWWTRNTTTKCFSQKTVCFFLLHFSFSPFAWGESHVILPYPASWLSLTCCCSCFQDESCGKWWNGKPDENIFFSLPPQLLLLLLTVWLYQQLKRLFWSGSCWFSTLISHSSTTKMMIVLLGDSSSDFQADGWSSCCCWIQLTFYY